jgi:5-methylcytosine-specific restriction enzyme A
VLQLGSGVSKKGVVAAGVVVSDPFLGPHHNPQRAKLGDEVFFVNCHWNRILDCSFEEPLSLDELHRLADYKWSIQASGVQAPSDVEAALHVLWENHVREIDGYVATKLIGAQEGRSYLAKHYSRDRELRAEKIRSVLKAKQCLRCEVPGCGFDFEAVYGEIGREYAETHHLVPFGEHRVRITSLDDLVIVCSNCHSMIHRGGGCRLLDSLIPEAK